jgi:Tfp pilus assembly protein PilN
MSARKTTARINLLPQMEFNTTFWGRTLLWALSSFRIIVILVEMVVMLAFMSRFWLDAKSNDLNDAIKQKSGVVLAFSDFEKEFKNTQKRLAIFSQVASNSDITSSSLIKITSYLPDEITLTNYSVTSGQIEIKGKAASEVAVAQLSANLKNDKQTFSNIVVAGMTTNNEDPTAFDFDLKFSITGKAVN